MSVNELSVREFLRKKGDYLHHREGQELEFKEQFNLSALPDYFRDFAAFSNNRGGYLVFGVTDSPRTAAGLNPKSIELFEKIDPERVSGVLLEHFSGDIRWTQDLVEFESKQFGAFYIEEAVMKPVVAKKDLGNNKVIKNGDIYFRYGGRTQRIQHAELERIIDERVERNNSQWLDLMSKIGRVGPSKAAILDTEKGVLEKNDARIIVLDEILIEKLKFIREGEFNEVLGSPTLKLVGDVVPVDRIEVIKRVKESLTKQFPLSAMELVAEVQRRYPAAKTNKIWEVISQNGLKRLLKKPSFRSGTSILHPFGTLSSGTRSFAPY